MTAHIALAASPPIDDQIWVYDSKGRCDPFVPLVRDGRVAPCEAQPGAQTERGPVMLPSLGGILWDPNGRSIALINGNETKVGDTVDGYRITTIDRDEVVLMRETERVVLRINFDATKPPKEGAGRREVKAP